MREGPLQGAPPLSFCLEPAPVDLELEICPMRKDCRWGNLPRPTLPESRRCRRFGATSSGPEVDL